MEYQTENHKKAKDLIYEAIMKHGWIACKEHMHADVIGCDHHKRITCFEVESRDIDHVFINVHRNLSRGAQHVVIVALSTEVRRGIQQRITDGHKYYKVPIHKVQVIALEELHVFFESLN